ncbi:MAG: protein kinase [Coriobacteriia bacterium]
MPGLERYRIDGELGRGAMGVVYDAWDLTLDRRIALKELALPPGLAEAHLEEMVERFAREARSAARLSHHNVVQIHDVFDHDGRHFIAMEYLDGLTLAELMSRGPLPVSAAVAVVVQILDAVQSAHDAGIVHRDIKPDNIFVLEDGRVKVTDFGIAKLLDSTSQSTMTQVGTVLGTPGYMAPEQVMGLPVDGRADIFAIGVVGYELIAGFNPFLAPSSTATLYRIVHEEPPPLTAHGAPNQVEAVFRRALAKDPNQRYAQALEMAAHLRGGVTPSTVAAQDAATGATQVRARRNPIHVFLTIGVVMLGAAAIIALVILAGAGPTGGHASGAASILATTVSTAELTMPDVVGQDVETARIALAANGFDVRVDSAPSGSPAGTVLSTDPSAGTAGMKTNSVVRVTVAAAGGTPTAVAPPATSAVSGVVAGDYTPGWTCVYNSLKDESQAVAAMNQLAAQGEQAAVIDTDYFKDDKGKGLTAGYYAVIFGSFSSRAEASAASKRYPSPDCYPRYAAPK